MDNMTAGEVLSHLKSRAGHLWEDICDLIIRPQRAEYSAADLGPKLFRLTGKSPKYVREDIELENMRGMKLQCSWYRPAPVPPVPPATTEEMRRLPCVVYLHGNCGCRLDGQEALSLLAEGMTVFTFDAAGSGLSEGDFVSLGFYERQDLACVVDYLQSSGEVRGIGLWGRSMGAVTAIMYASRDPAVSAIVCDSPFSTLRLLVQSLVTAHAPLVPQVVVKGAVSRIRKNVMRRAGFDIRGLDTLKFAAQCTTPAFIYHGKDDDFVHPDHSTAVAEHYAGSCMHHLVSGDHNSSRLPDATDIVKEFFRLYLIDKLNASCTPPLPPPEAVAAIPKAGDEDCGDEENGGGDGDDEDSDGDDAEAEAAAAEALQDPTLQGDGSPLKIGLPTPRTSRAHEEFASEEDT